MTIYILTLSSSVFSSVQVDIACCINIAAIFPNCAAFHMGFLIFQSCLGVYVHLLFWFGKFSVYDGKYTMLLFEITAAISLTIGMFNQSWLSAVFFPGEFQESVVTDHSMSMSSTLQPYLQQIRVGESVTFLYYYTAYYK